MRLSAIILSSLFSAVPSYPLFNFGKSLPELHKWIVKDGSQVDPHSHLNLKDRLMAAGDTGDRVIGHRCHRVTTSSPIGTQSSGPPNPQSNYRRSIWNSSVGLITAGSCVGEICVEGPTTLFNLGKPSRK